ncbi:hypothetical protein [Streptomyces sp. TRM72054]|uniref:hypothetical protein n=1 Tax=Streptomyces sp. TRM72054 TaxID=2870562 RepID=UPI0027E1514D|nr:hypothetical protein [Streptomyces sp. TRM72054]
MQAKLHRWAVAGHGFRFDDVFGFVCGPAVLMMAFERVAGNKGARTAGVDGQSAADVQESGVTAHLNRIRSALKAGTFRPLPVRERMIPKSGGKLRRLGIPTVTDRGGAGRAEAGPGADLRGGFPSVLVRVPAQPAWARRDR